MADIEGGIGGRSDDAGAPAGATVADFRALMPADWQGLDLMVAGYQGLTVSRSALAEPVLLHLGDVRVVLFYGSLSYQGVRSVRLNQSADAAELQINMDLGQPHLSPDGPHALLLTPMDSEPACKDRLNTVAGFVASFQGKDLVYERLFETIDSPRGMTLFTPSVEMPGMHGAPNLHPEYLRFITESHAQLAAMPDDDRRRLGLGLRWIDAAIRDRGVDAFIRYWLAIEVVGMPDGTNIRPVNETLAQIYSIPYEEARDRFMVGRLYGRRSKIVHHGNLDPVDAKVLMYLFMLFTDLLRAQLGIQPSFRVGRAVDDPRFAELSELIG